jgi:hypothetical protein
MRGVMWDWELITRGEQIGLGYFDVAGALWSIWEIIYNILQIESPQIICEMNMRSFGKATRAICFGRLKKEQVPFPRIIFEYKEMEATCFRFFPKLIEHVADVLSRVVSCELLPQMIHVTIEESGNVIISNKLASSYYFSKIAVPYREFFTELDRFLLFGGGK